MRILIDTNVFIDRENYHLVPPNLQQLLSLLGTANITILVHPGSVDEIRRDGNEERRNIILSKVQTYPLLPSPPDPSNDPAFLSVVGPAANMNDYIDNLLLYAAHKDAVDFLISEDRGLQQKASKLDVRDRVLSVEEALMIFRAAEVRDELAHPPALRHEYVYNLNIGDPFFDSLKTEYPSFGEWWQKISREGRRCFVYFEADKSIGALLVYKFENELIGSDPPISASRRLKLCTFKVVHTGHRIGELFIKLSVQICVNNHIDEIYLTRLPSSDESLVELISEYGFERVARKGAEDVYFKKLMPDRRAAESMLPHEISRVFYPTFYDGLNVRKFIVPIVPKYHNRLFTDYKDRQTTIPEHAGEFVVEGNTISKAYLTHSRIQRIGKGDVLLFYRSVSNQELTSVGVVERVALGLRQETKVITLVAKKTVYSLKELRELVRKPTTVILFKLHFHLRQPIKLEKLVKMRIFKRPPQSIVGLQPKKYLLLKAEGGVDERYTVH